MSLLKGKKSDNSILLKARNEVISFDEDHKQGIIPSLFHDHKFEWSGHKLGIHFFIVFQNLFLDRSWTCAALMKS